MSETRECERYIAEAWFDGVYTEEDAKLSAELQGLDFKNISDFYGNLYAEMECLSCR